MKKRWIAIAAIVLVAGILTGVLLSRGETTTPNPTPTPTAQTPTPKPSTTTTQTPAPTPTAQTPTSVPAGAIGAQEFITKATAGKYKIGEEITVSAVYESYYRDPKITMFFFFGPQANGDYLIIDGNLTDAGTIPFGELKKGDRVIIRGDYKGFMTIDGKKGGVLDFARIIK